MRFIEMTGSTLRDVVKEGEFDHGRLEAMGINERSVIRINQQGDLELRKAEGWDIIGGLIGDFEHRVKHATGLDWA